MVTANWQLGNLGFEPTGPITVATRGSFIGERLGRALGSLAQLDQHRAEQEFCVAMSLDRACGLLVPPLERDSSVVHQSHEPLQHLHTYRTSHRSQAVSG
jgi:hypothetical protein